MPSGPEYFKQQPSYCIWLNGEPGAGKTLQACSFPRAYGIAFDPSGFDTVRQPGLEQFQKNIIWVETVSGDRAALDKVFDPASKDLTTLYGNLSNARQLAVNKEIDTFILDGFSYLVALRWQSICEFEKIEGRTGTIDTRGMYQKLGVFLTRFVMSDLLPLSTRYGLNVIVTCHVQRESQQQLEGGAEPTSKRAVNLKSDLAPQVIGGFRQMVDGLPSGLLYLEHRLSDRRDKDGKVVLGASGAPDQYIQHLAYCQKVKSGSYDTEIKAKNRYGLPPVIDLTRDAEHPDRSLYASLSLRHKQSLQQQQAVALGKTSTAVAATPPKAAVPAPATSAIAGHTTANKETGK